jgi:hypothetical protein
MPKPSLTIKYKDRLTEISAGYKLGLEKSFLHNSPVRDLPEYFQAYASVKGDLEYRARGFALAVREIFRQRSQAEESHGSDQPI